jgi:hypothetical protein
MVELLGDGLFGFRAKMLTTCSNVYINGLEGNDCIKVWQIFEPISVPQGVRLVCFEILIR